MDHAMELNTQSKNEAIKYVQKVFKGHDAFISSAVTLIAGVSDFKGIESTGVILNDFAWEAFLVVEIDHGERGYKRLTYRKGNKDYDPFSKVHDYSVRSNEDEISWEV